MQWLQTLSPRNYDVKINYQYFVIALFVPNTTFNSRWWDPIYYSSEPTVIANYEDDLDSSYSALDRQGFTFLTCSGSSIASYNFQAYVSMYDEISWSLAFIPCVLSSTVLWLGLNLTLSNETRWQRGNWDWPYRVLLEQGIENVCAQPDRKGLQRIAIRIMLGVWFVMGVILSNGYRGNNIYELTSPLKISGPTTISELMKSEIKIYSRLSSKEESNIQYSLKSYCSNGDFNFLRNPSSSAWNEDIFQTYQNKSLLPRCTGQLRADMIFGDDIERYVAFRNMLETVTNSGPYQVTPGSPCVSISKRHYDKFQYLTFDSSWSTYDNTSFSRSVRITELGIRLKLKLYELCVTQIGDNITSKEMNIAFKLTKYLRVLPSFQVSTPLLSILSAIEGCNETSFMGWDSEVRQIRTLYNKRYPEKQIFTGTDPVFTNSVRFAIRGFWGRPAILRMFGLIESGLASKWREIHEFNQVLKIHSSERNKSRVYNKARVKTLAISDNIVTVFYLLLICIGVPMVSFLMEVVVMNRRAMWFQSRRILKMCVIKFRNCRKNACSKFCPITSPATRTLRQQ
ncbi:hypothetical protein Fcan01_18945 [Folsomia candida]|uniref:Uncharacterized protein n=1 Tax=Folsomia candida TaxID=158441 RepID=A0A226DML4_FOLCA|nr:hypothetical protein Fcan01_18945 [Folsomia candida]